MAMGDKQIKELIGYLEGARAKATEAKQQAEEARAWAQKATQSAERAESELTLTIRWAAALLDQNKRSFVCCGMVHIIESDPTQASEVERRYVGQPPQLAEVVCPDCGMEHSF